VTPASVHDSQVFDELLEQTEESDGHKRAVYADRDYERIQNAGNLPYNCFRHFFEKWSASYDFIWIS